MRKFILGAWIACSALMAVWDSGSALAYERAKERCSYVQCVDHCIKNGEAPKGTYRGGGGCGKFCRRKGCN